jgi:hypothetical protein
MRPDKAALVVNTVLKRTSEGKVDWKPTSGDDAFEVSFPNETLRVVTESGTDPEGDPYTTHYLEILNKSGKVVDTITAYEVRSSIRESWEVMRMLFAQAREKALGIDETVDDLLASLGGPALDTNEEEIPF